MSDSSTAGGDASAVAISIGAVVKRSFAIFFANLVPFGILALILHLPGLLYNLATIDEAMGGLEPTFSTGQIIVSLLSLVLGYLLIGALVYGTVAQLRGQPAGMGLIISKGLSMVLPVIVIAIAVSIITAIGFVLFIVPGVFLVVVYAVVVPAYVVERPGIVGAFKRSWELTKGNRWRVLGILVIFVVILLVVGALVGGVAGVTIAFGGGFSLLALVNYVVGALSAAVMSVGAAVLYHDLRIAKEGVSTDQIAAVFD
ncbi:hypothetical protein [Pelagibius sp.]|uniref:hypothetical protein n=1 Tax=Pelagibius sp. TaxID=1931238 RepID=UPI003B508225